MDDYIDRLWQLENFLYTETRLLRERINPFHHFRDEEFRMRYRMSKGSVYTLLQQVVNELEYGHNRNEPIPAPIQLMMALRFYATAGSYWRLGRCTRDHRW